MTEGLEKLASWQLHRSKFDVIVVYRADVELQAADKSLRLEIAGDDNTLLPNKLLEALSSTQRDNVSYDGRYYFLKH